jgi:hypothetical protein
LMLNTSRAQFRQSKYNKAGLGPNIRIRMNPNFPLVKKERHNSLTG